jgi:hypothetical protein
MTGERGYRAGDDSRAARAPLQLAIVGGHPKD